MMARAIMTPVTSPRRLERTVATHGEADAVSPSARSLAGFVLDLQKYAAAVPYRMGDSAVPSPAGDTSDATWRVLEAVRRGRATSRSELAEVTGLGRAVVAQRIDELGAAGLVTQLGFGPSSGGRPPRRIRFRHEAGHVLSVDLGATSIDAAVADLDGRIIAHTSEPADIGRGPDVVLGRVEDLLTQLAEGVARAGTRYGVGIGVPGPVEFRTGRPVAPPIMPGWDDYPIRERLEARFEAPVWVDNDVNVMALGDWRAGVAQAHSNVIFVKIGTGIGAGLILDGRPYRGSNGSAGDLGHAQIVEDGVVCRCGNVGCLEAIAGGQALAREAETLARTGRSPYLRTIQEGGRIPHARDVGEGASRGDPACVELLQSSGRAIGVMLATMVNLFNPSLIVLGGGVAAAGDVYLAAIRETVYRRSLPLATRRLSIVHTGLGSLAGVIGAAAMVADELFSREQLARTLARHEVLRGRPVAAREVLVGSTAGSVTADPR